MLKLIVDDVALYPTRVPLVMKVETQPKEPLLLYWRKLPVVVQGVEPPADVVVATIIPFMSVARSLP